MVLSTITPTTIIEYQVPGTKVPVAPGPLQRKALLTCTRIGGWTTKYQNDLYISGQSSTWCQ